jgi:hypothetical protein
MVITSLFADPQIVSQLLENCSSELWVVLLGCAGNKGLSLLQSCELGFEFSVDLLRETKSLTSGPFGDLLPEAWVAWYLPSGRSGSESPQAF